MRDPQQTSIQRFPVSLYASIDFLSGSLYNPYCSQVNYQEGHIDEADSVYPIIPPGKSAKDIIIGN